MYFVYRLKIGDYEYVGCTNNIRRRKDQHNGNARNRKSKLGQYLSDNGIVLKVTDFDVVAEYASRVDALRHERSMALELADKGAKLLNDNYSHECTRKGKNIGNTAKEYVVVDYDAHTATQVRDLRQYCIKQNWDYSLVQRTAKQGQYCKHNCKAFFAEDWAKEPNKEKYISGAFVDEVIQSAKTTRVKKTSKLYEVMFPDGHTEIIKNADKFAREHGLTPGTFHATLIFNKPTKGYQVLRRI